MTQYVRQSLRLSAAAALLACATLASAQSLSFEVAAIKPDKSGTNDSHWNDHNSKMTATNVTLRQLIAFAYSVHDFQISGPDWLRSEHYDIQAEGDAWASRGQRPAVMQNLLTDRFKLVVHRETKEQPVYALVIATHGLKLQAVDPNGQSGVSSSRGRMTLQKASMKEIVDSLSRRVDRPVIDKTGLTGAFNGELQWVPDDDMSAANPTASAAGVDAGPSIFTALQEQFGLKLVPQKSPVELLVVDQAERVPTEN